MNDLVSKLYGLREVVLVIESHDEDDDDVTKSVCVHENGDDYDDKKCVCS